MTRRIRIHLSVGDIFQLAGIAGAAIAVGHLAGTWWGVLLAAVFVVIDANLTYGNKTIAFSLPSQADRKRAQWLLAAPARRARRVAFLARVAWADRSKA